MVHKRSLVKALAVAALVPSALVPAALLAQAQDLAVTVGVTAGPHAQIAEVAKQVAARQGLKVRLVEFGDFIQPNAALSTGDLDANIYQHQPFLDAQNKDRGYKLVPVAKAVNQQMGVYSRKIRKLADLKSGARVGILGFTFKENVPDLRNTRVVDVIRERFGLSSLKFNTLETLVEAIGLPKCKICTHCFDGSSHF